MTATNDLDRLLAELRTIVQVNPDAAAKLDQVEVALKTERDAAAA